MKYQSVEEVANRIGVGVRTIQKWAKTGKIPGACKEGRDWRIPLDFDVAGREGKSFSREMALSNSILPFLNASFVPGKAQAFLDRLIDPLERIIAQAELAYFSGQPEKCLAILSEYQGEKPEIYVLAEKVLSVFSHLATGNYIEMDRDFLFFDRVYREIVTNEGRKNTNGEMYRIAAVFILSVVAVELHVSHKRPISLESVSGSLPFGAKRFAIYTMARKAFLEKDYGRAIGYAETAIICSPCDFPIAHIYCHLIAAICNMNLIRIERAKEHLIGAWSLAEKDGLLAPFGEMYAYLQGLVEITFRKSHPEVFREILRISESYQKGWRTVYNKKQNKNVTQALTSQEHTLALLYQKGWTAKEIASHLDLSYASVRKQIRVIYEKLGVSNRKSLEEYL